MMVKDAVRTPGNNAGVFNATWTFFSGAGCSKVCSHFLECFCDKNFRFTLFLLALKSESTLDR